jgi:peroxiredoxin
VRSMSEPDPLDDVFKRICTLEAPLNERLALYSEALRQHAPSYAEAYDELVARLQTTRTGWSAPDVGDEMPAFSLPDPNYRMYSLAEMLTRGPAVVSFNRGHWCPYCLTELKALKRALAEINSAGGQVVSIMPETREFTAQVAEETSYAFPILSDENNGYALSLNLVMWIGDRVRKLLIADGVQLEYSQGNASWFVPIPATFVVGADGRIVARLVDPDFRKRMDIDEIIAALHLARQ